MMKMAAMGVVMFSKKKYLKITGLTRLGLVLMKLAHIWLAER